MAAFRKLSTKRNGGGGGEEGGYRAGGGRWAVWETCQQGPKDKGLIWAHMLSLWKFLELGHWGWGKVKGREKEKKGRGGGRMSSPAREPGFSLDWKQTQSVLGTCSLLPQGLSKWLLLKGHGEMERGAKKEEAALSRRPSPVVGDVKGGTAAPPRCAEMSLGSLQYPVPTARTILDLIVQLLDCLAPACADLGSGPVVAAGRILHKSPSPGVGSEGQIEDFHALVSYFCQ